MPLNWKIGGPLLGIVFFLAVLLARPIGVSTQFVLFDAFLWNLQQPDAGIVTRTAEGVTSTNAYLAKSDGALAAGAADLLTYPMVFVLAMMVGALLSSLIRSTVPKGERNVPAMYRANIGGFWPLRWVMAFAGGVLVLYGARLAGGCTSGHMMSGMMQSSISGFVFAFGAFLTAFPTAMMLLKKEG
ncbi:YeeE/YedE family protein [Rhodovulum sulfidophilum]|uniref:YeeE/YedE family protein n=1 Tax=Rhodovulum sulfidophilum TaxID=35806 RepID=A0A0D6B2B7_RHOSU|nr:YeeE/YedE family protein [Rhodovulum sulfidophilum]